VVPEIIEQQDREQARQFLQIVTDGWGDLHEPAMIELRCLFPGKTSDVRRFEPTPEGIDALIEHAAVMNRHGLNTYPVINPVRASAPLRRDGRASGAEDSDIIGAFWFWADGDDEAAVYAIKNFAGPKWTMAVTTGRVPHPRPHIYWRVEDGPIMNLKQWQRIQQGIAAQLSTDKTVVNPSRIMRLPGMVNWPTEKKVAKGRVAELATLRTEYDDDRDPVPFERMRRIFEGAAPAQTAGDGFQIDTGALPTLDRALAAANILAGTDWRENVKKLVASYVARGWTDEEIVTRCLAFTLPGWTDDETRADVAAFIKWTRRREAENGGKYAESPETTGGAASILPVPDTPPFDTSPVSVGDLTGLAPRRWLFGRKLIRGFCSVAISPGGGAKSTWSAAITRDMIEGIQSLHDAPHGNLKVWVYNLEDPKEETLRKFSALHHHKRIDSESLSRLIVSSGRDRPLIVATEVERGVFLPTPDVPALIEAIKAAGVDVLIVDPAVRAHTLPENDNKAIDLMMDQFARIAHEADVAVLLIHHTRKGFVGGEMDSMRGASSMGSAARVVLSLQPMSPEEAADMNIPEAERRLYVRADNAKANLTPPASGAEWYKLESVYIGNANEEYPDGDHVGVITKWAPPDPWADIGPFMIEIMDRIRRGFVREDGSTEPFSMRKQAGPERHVANAVLASFPQGDKSEKQAMGIIKHWIGKGFLEEREYTNAKGNARKGVFVTEKADEDGQ